MALDLRGGNSILGLMGHIQEQGELGRQEGNKRGLAGLLSKGMTANPMQQREMLSKGMAIDPDGTQKVAGMFKQQNDDALDHFGKLSAAAAANPSDPHLLRQWAQAGAQINMLPPEVLQKDFSDPADIEGAGKAVQAYARAFGGAGAPEQFTLGPGSKRFDAGGNVVAEVPHAPQRPDYIFQTGADGQGYWLPKPTGMPQAPTAGAPAPSTGGGGQMMRDTFDAAVAPLLEREGGYVANDAGAGPTNYGINSRANPDVNVASLTPMDAKELYKERYWDAIGADQLPPQLREAAFDAVVNMGVGKARELLQQSGGDPAKFDELRRQHYGRLAQGNPEQYGQYAAGWDRRVAETGAGGPQAAPGGAIPVPGFRGAPKGRDAPSGYQYAPDGQSLVPIPGGPADKPTAKPMPVSALRLVRDSREKLSIADGNIQSLSRIGQQLQSGQINLGVLDNAASKARNFTGMSTPESKNFALMMSSLEKLRNDSLRLNNGVQTEGDAQRAWNELMGNLNDEKVAAAQINRIIEINRRAAQIHQENMDDVTANYQGGAGADEQQADDDIESLMELYR